MRVFVLSISLIAVTLVGGCGKTIAPGTKSINAPQGTSGSSVKNPESAPVHAIITPSNDSVGRVISVNQQAKYAVLGYPLGNLPALNSRVYSYRNGLKVGELRVSGPQRENNTVADLLTGECQPGDEVKKD
ncbi:MAG TPA: hypothetical protein VMZ27_00245 [Candidatus Saccharimonadales bacterium]|nr:hypothetical protein [Candidatus Saccharimonadales bacterium]